MRQCILKPEKDGTNVRNPQESLQLRNCEIVTLKKKKVWLKITTKGLPWWLSGKESVCQGRKQGFDPVFPGRYHMCSN